MMFRNLILALSALTVSTQLWALEARIAVAANFTGVTQDLGPVFENQTGHKLKFSYGSTGKLYAQIENGAPYDAFLAADTQRPLKAVKEGLALPDTYFIYATGKLLLWSAKNNAFEQGEEYLKTADFARVAIANPKTAPYGLAAQQVMEHIGIRENLQPRLVRGDSISQTFQFVATGNAAIGFVAYSQIKVWKGEPGTVWDIPSGYYAPIDQAAVLLKPGERNPAASEFLDFLKSEAALKIIQNYGYSTP
ncbi:MAG: molybdate ABC transporter substrate-binding protein [Gammaproteobacteria bacterium]